MCKNHDFCISAKTDAIQNNIDTKSRNKDSKTDIGPKAGEDTFINKKPTAGSIRRKHLLVCTIHFNGAFSTRYGAIG